MACGRRLQEFSTRLGYHLCSIDRYGVARHCITSRKIYLSARHCKIPKGNTKDKDVETINDLDFFGLNESSSVSRARSKKESEKFTKTERLYINELIEKHAAPLQPENVQKKSFGAIRYDRKIPERENTTITKRQKRKERYLKNESQHNSTEIRNTSFPASEEQQNLEKNLSFVDEQYFNYDGMFDKAPPVKQTNMQMDTIQVSDGQPTKQSSKANEEVSSAMNKEIIDVGQKESSKTVINEQNMSFIDEQYFSYSCNNAGKTPEVPAPSSRSFTKPKDYVQNIGKESMTTEKELSLKLDKNDRLEEETFKENKENLSFIDNQFFSYNSLTNEMPSKKQKDQPTNHKMQTKPQFTSESLEKRVTENDRKYSYTLKRKNREMVKEKSRENDSDIEKEIPLNQKKISDNLAREIQENEAGGTESVYVQSRKWTDRAGISELNQQQKKQTAYDTSMKIRAKFEQKRDSNLIGKFNPRKYDSKGFRILGEQVPHFDNAPSIDVVKVLRDSIIYDQNDILGISKPYGLPSHDGPGVFHSIGKLLDQIVPKTKLFPVHRLDKETTGVMLFAKTEEMANRLSECFLRREVTKKYLVITKNIPEQQTGEIDIPVAEGTVDGKGRMCLRPYYSQELRAVMKKRQDGTKAVTRFRVLDTGNKCAILECIPVTGKKHQVRVHLAFGLNCPILGDHKYSHINKIAPMRLHPEMLKCLKIQQSKVRYLAMHLHARSVTIPEFLNGRNLFISAPLPPHFVRNLKDLKLKLPPYC